MRTLILGGTGFIGRHLTMKLLEAGHDLAIFHRGQRDVPFSRHVVSIQGDRRWLKKYAPEFAAFSPQVVVDLIAFTEADAQSTMATFAGLAERLICASSMDVYRAYGAFLRLESDKPRSGLSENAPLRTALFPYRALARDKSDPFFDYEKILVERVVINKRDLAATVLRLPAVFGPHDGQRRLRIYLRQMDAGEEIIISEAKARWRWTRGYVEDIAAGLALAVTHPKAAGRIYNLGEREATSELDWIRRIGRAVGWEGQPRIVCQDALPNELAEPYDWRHHLAGGTLRIRQELGYRETIPEVEAMARSVAWERSI